MKGSGHDLVEVLPWHLPKELMETLNNLGEDSWCLSRDSH
jgi:hypothetical protein